MLDGWETFLFCFYSFVSQILTHAPMFTATGTIFFSEASTSIRFPTGPATTCSSISGKSSSAAPGCERGVCRYRQSRVTGVNSPTRGWFKAIDRSHLSAPCCLSPNRTDRAALVQSHHSKKNIVSKNEWTISGAWYSARDANLLMFYYWRQFYVAYYYPCREAI